MDESRQCVRCGKKFGAKYHPERDLCMGCWCSRFDAPAGIPQSVGEDRPGNRDAGIVNWEMAPDHHVPSEAQRLNHGFSLMFRHGEDD